MLSAMRGWLNSWVAKGLFGLLILSFAVWGIGDFVTGGRGVPSSVATVGDREVSMAEATEAFRREMTALQRSFGGNFEAGAPLRRRIAEDVVNRLATFTALNAEAERLGITVTDDVVRETVFGAQPFRGLDGRFSRVAFESFLRNAGLSEARFLELLRQDLVRQQLLSAVRAGAAAPEPLVRLLFAFRSEAREAHVVEMPFIAAAAPPEPSEDELRRFWENEQARFTAPEYRRFSLLTLTVEDVARDITPTAAQLQAAYEARAGEFITPERRQLEQLVVAGEAPARMLAEAWRGGLDLAAMTERATAEGGTALPLGLLSAAELPDQALAAAAFAAPVGAVTEPVRTAFGWHVLRVAEVVPGATRAFGEVRDELARDVAQDLAGERIYTIANRVEDSIAEGLSLTEVARRHALGFREIAAIDRDGLGPDGARVAVGPEALRRGAPQVIDTVFSTQPGTTTRLVETDGAAFFAIRLEGVTPPAVQPFESVSEQVKAAWEAQERRRAMEASAAAMLAAIRAGAGFEAAAIAQGWTPRRIGPFVRTARGAGAPPAAVLQALFGLKDGDATMVEANNAFIVLAVASIAVPEATEERIRPVRETIASSIADDLEAQFAEAIRARAGVKINQRAVGLLVGTDP